MGGYGTYLGWEIRKGNGGEPTLTGSTASDLHPKLMGGESAASASLPPLFVDAQTGLDWSAFAHGQGPGRSSARRNDSLFSCGGPGRRALHPPPGAPDPGEASPRFLRLAPGGTSSRGPSLTALLLSSPRPPHDQPRSPHTITALAGLGLLAANGVIGNIMQGARPARPRGASGLRVWRHRRPSGHAWSSLLRTHTRRITRRPALPRSGATLLADKAALRTTHAFLGTSLMAVFLVHAGLGLAEGFSF